MVLKAGKMLCKCPDFSDWEPAPVTSNSDLEISVLLLKLVLGKTLAFLGLLAFYNIIQTL